MFGVYGVVRDTLRDTLREEALQEGEFRLASGQISEYYLDCRTVLYDSFGITAAEYLFRSRIKAQVRAVAGIGYGAAPLVAALCFNSRSRAIENSGRLSGIMIRSDFKAYGVASHLMGPALARGTEVLLVEDVITTGNSLMHKAIPLIEEAGYKVSQIIALVDRQQGGLESLIAAGYDAQAVYTINQIRGRA